MNDAETASILVNELRRIDRAMGETQRVLDAADKKSGLRVIPHQYSVELSFDVVTSPDTPTPDVKSFVIDRDCQAFFCCKISYTLLAVGEIAVTATANKITIPAKTRGLSCPFMWTVRDSSSDREWQDQPMPSFLLASGQVDGHRLPKPAILPSGSEVQVSAQPLVTTARVVGFTVDTVQRYIVQMSFSGFEVI